jgi:hypothetical protein
MRNKNIWLSIIVTTTILVACNNSKENPSRKKLEVAAANASIKFQCPMECESDTSYTTSGNCPVCNMELQRMD